MGIPHRPNPADRQAGAVGDVADRVRRVHHEPDGSLYEIRAAGR